MTKKKDNNNKQKGCPSGHSNTETEEWESPGPTKPIRFKKVVCKDCGELLVWEVDD